MHARVLTACILGTVLLGGAAAWWRGWSFGAPAATEPLPLPPVPPRIAQGEQYERCLAMLPDDPAGAQGLAESWLAAAGGEGAEHCRALARIGLGDPATGAALLEGLAARSEASGAARAMVYDQAAQAWLMAGNAARGFDAGSAALALSPETPDLLIDRALNAEALERWADATEDLGHALEADPRRSDALVLRASALRHLGRLDAAEADVNRALALDPESAEALLERGILYQRRDNQRDARAAWERAIAVAPNTQTADLAQQDLALLEAGPERR
jgi:tetratricopeptide (TPR) repeat protein